MPPKSVSNCLSYCPKSDGMHGWSTNLQAYGLTEYSCITITHCNPSHGRRHAKPGSVGFLVPGIELKFVDQHTGLSLPVNVPGELCVRGESCMKGKENSVQPSVSSSICTLFFHSHQTETTHHRRIPEHRHSTVNTNFPFSFLKP